ncbi:MULTISPECIES: hypothetical protein [unclassified Roseitalea]|uniref:hypothetical protein n=1 Tax=unclassified Roseitalea TaxID=2639107 RepID=UPI00273DB2FD|nr:MULTISPECIES: hypothetical protein [unclassified Roseitalea]
MGLLGTGAVAIWHDIAPEGREEFYAWHGREHMPERVAIPGFRRGRRYVAIEADREFFNLYEAEAPDVLTGPDYQARLNDPTPWTVATVRHFRGVARSLCAVAASAGEGGGGLAATFRYDVDPAAHDGHVKALGLRFAPLLASPHVAGAHVLLADIAASRVDTAERKAREEPNTVPGAVVVIEGWGDEAAFLAALKAHLPPDALAKDGAREPIAGGVYRLQATALAPP